MIGIESDTRSQRGIHAAEYVLPVEWAELPVSRSSKPLERQARILLLNERLKLLLEGLARPRPGRHANFALPVLDPRPSGYPLFWPIHVP